MIEQNKSTIKILYVITSTGLGGAEKLLLSYLKNLDKDRYKIYVCSLREKPDDLQKEMSEYSEIIKINIKNKFNPFVLLKLIKIFRNLKPDIIHTHLFQARVYSTIAHLFYRQAVLITHKHSVVNPKKHNIFIVLEMLCILLNDRIIAISESVKNSLLKYEFIPEKKIIVLHNCIDYKNFNNIAINKRNLKGKDIVIGTVGRVEKVKGLRYLLLAMKIILIKFPDTKLQIVGDGSEINLLKDLAVKINISKSVFFFGKFTDVIPFYKRMDIFVLPSILEGFGIVLLEAMAAGVPVIATKVDGIKEVIINMKNGLLVPSKNPEAIADAVIRLIEDPELTKDLVGNGFERAKLFDIQNHIMKLEQLYANLLGVESSQ